MARLTNKQLEIVVDEIYKKVSLPIIESNKKALDAIKIEDDEYLLACKKYKVINKKLKKVEKELEAISKEYKNKTINGFELGYWHTMDQPEEYTNHLKVQQSKPKDVPSKDDIEREIILTGNADIPELIESIVNKLK